MLTNYYTLRALIAEWNPLLAGARLVDAYSQHKGSLILVFESPDERIHSLNLSTQAPHRHLFRYEGVNRARRNVVDHFPRLRDKVLKTMDLADGDRLLTLHFDGGHRLVLLPFGTAANALHVLDGNEVVDGFKGNLPEAVPAPRPAVMPDTPEAVEALLRSGRPVRKLWPLLSGPLADELVHRAGGTEDPLRLLETASSLLDALARPEPRMYVDADGAPLLALIALRHLEWDHEAFPTVDEAVRVCARRRMAQARFEGSWRPLLQAIRRRRDQAARSLERVEEELLQPSRADRYEHLGHLLMAQPQLVEAGAEVTQLPDLLGDGSLVTIRLDPFMTPIENAQRLYGKAKANRAAREAAFDRLDGLRAQLEELDAMLGEATSLEDIKSVQGFEQRHAKQLARLRQSADDEDGIPYRRFDVGNGYEVWVGRNAKQNDTLTLHDARPFDVWMHARGVAGSHAVLRVKGRQDVPPKPVLEKAAAIAAWFSKARTHSLAPVIMTQRKYVRKPRKALPGAVLVEREQVIMIEPGLPDDKQA